MGQTDIRMDVKRVKIEKDRDIGTSIEKDKDTQRDKHGVSKKERDMR